VNSNGLAPRWASAPGATIEAALRERGLTVQDLSGALGLPEANVASLIAGEAPITVSVAHILAGTIGGSPEFWLVREAQYLDDLAYVEADRWSGSFPVDQMVSFGWIQEPANWHERIDAIFEFFGVETVAGWAGDYATSLDVAHFRRSPAFEIDTPATTAWFRACERQADEGRAVSSRTSFDAAEFAASLQIIRSLTRVRDPRVFLPELARLCANAGVDLVVVRAPVGCPVSGCSRVYGGRPLIQLSARFLSDDHFWFTFFHEAAHVLLHGLQVPFVDVLEDEAGDPFEAEANEFATELLVAGALDTAQPLRAREVIRLAHSIGVSSGVLVGQLQYRGMLRRDHLNGLKRRYRWDGASLEMGGTH